MNPTAALSIILLHALFCFQGTHSRTILLRNNCRFRVWPAVEATSKKPARCPAQINMEEALRRKDTTEVWVPNIWRGKIWARTGCVGEEGNIKCATGDCGTDSLKCDGSSGAPPFTAANFDLNANAGQDTYRVSLASGFNIPIEITPANSECETSACKDNINEYCPENRQVNGRRGKVVGCRALGYFEHDSFFLKYCENAVTRSDSSEKCKDVNTNYAVTFCP